MPVSRLIISVVMKKTGGTRKNRVYAASMRRFDSTSFALVPSLPANLLRLLIKKSADAKRSIILHVGFHSFLFRCTKDEG